VFVGAAAYHGKAKLIKFVGESTRVFHDLLGIFFKLGASCFVEGDADTSNRVIHGPALKTGEDGGVESGGELGTYEDHGADGAAQRFAGSHGDDVSVGEGRVIDAGGDKSCFVGDIGEIESTDRVGNLAHFLVINFSRIGGTTANYHLRFYLSSLLANKVVIEVAGGAIDVVVMRGEKARSKGNRLASRESPAVGEVTAVVKREGEKFVTRGKKGSQSGQVGVTAGRALEIDVPLPRIKTKELERPFFYEAFDRVDVVIALVIAFAGAALTVFIDEYRAKSLADGVADEVLARNKGDVFFLALFFGPNELGEFGISGGKRGDHSRIVQ